ncbi:MAG: methyl-accepting chemotaxis protein [Chromatiaceae bacterium]|nr:methyl-accepting chemotaxis protein [Gammaproteobacteria bacterium]MCP5446428.1 methyl-accepting chemotaxis protein [Chromatiaceae bacterium]
MAISIASMLKTGGRQRLLPIFGITIFTLISASFAALSYILPAQVSSSLQQGINDQLLPGVRSAITESGQAIKQELDAKRDATLTRVKHSFNAQNEAKGKALIKTLLPLVENYDFDTATQILADAVDADSAIAAIRYRLQAGDQPALIGDEKLPGLLPFKVAEKSSFADVEIDLLVLPDLLTQAESEERGSFSKIEAYMLTANQMLERRTLEESAAMQRDTLASMRIRVWLLAGVGVILLVGVTLLVMQRLVIVPLERTKRHLLAIAEGDLTHDFEYRSSNELGEMAEAMNTMVANLRRIVAEINRSVTTLTSHADSLNRNTGSVVEGARGQALQAVQAASAITELSASFNEVAQSSNSASESARSTSRQALSGRDIVSQTADEMNSIAAKVSSCTGLIGALNRGGDEIGNVVNVINGIAEQTNLLALNAAIEAARAGEQGRGFAVVADEVRTLASRTGDATREISQMIERIQVDTGKSVTSMNSVSEQVNQGVELAEKAQAAMNEIVQASEMSMQMATSIATAVEQQSLTTNEVSGNVERMAMVSRETKDASTSMQQAAQELAQLGTELEKAISWFAVK